MDSARLGRALGAGTRQLAKTAVEVGRAINTTPPGSAADAAGTGRSQATTAAKAAEAPRAAAPVPPQAPPPPPRATAKQVRSAARRSRGSFLKPLKQFTGTVWLQVTGTFFLLFALSLGTSAWKLRAARLAAGTPAEHHFWLYAVFAALFGYFAVSSFYRAEKR